MPRDQATTMERINADTAPQDKRIFRGIFACLSEFPSPMRKMLRDKITCGGGRVSFSLCKQNTHLILGRLRGAKLGWVLQNPECKIKIVSALWILDSMFEETLVSDDEYEALYFLQNPHGEYDTLALEGFDQESLFEGMTFVVYKDHLDYATIESMIISHGGRVADFDHPEPSKTLYLISDCIPDDPQFEEGLSRLHSKCNVVTRSAVWLENCVNVRSLQFEYGTMLWRQLLYVPWPSSPMLKNSSKYFHIAITGYTGTIRETLLQLIARTGEGCGKDFSNNNTHLICFAHKCVSPFFFLTDAVFP
mmetsp:Transcript_28446/g.74983  ORF Transcript_28446/g.74983 Transcript_28446/m.74983 type:complete len:306 (-) Transcript_28446:15-932(-)